MKETRRSVLKRIGLAVLGLGGMVAGTGSLRAAYPGPAEETMVFQGRGWHVYSRNLSKGRLPEGGDRMVAYGELFDAAGEARLGDFAATYFGLPEAVAGGRLASLEQHVFNLPGGAILGSGMTSAGAETQDEFAVVGGTGRYAGARGTYTVRQSHLEFGGDGTATITFRLMSEAAS